MHHDTLKWIFTLTGSTGRAARRRLRLIKLALDVVNRVSTKHRIAEAILQQNTSCKDKGLLRKPLTAVRNQQY